ncbi:RNA polymerase subunit sigma-70 [Nocardioides sp. Root190]|uniref:sigma-70 family RNA polymerase sigma factor n=1 Tax=Nocardioides sp. Root190 TaxID=1736488 RepID=UPI0006F56A11|nr:sigma-70 family RNA polymerase sigma factor [Nocardioides sp. Root190]KRB80274.1 RNA polymerase subunit sigma-70 [Nocardioides sp. Root190]
MTWDRNDVARGLEALRAAVVASLALDLAPALAGGALPGGNPTAARRTDHWLLSEAHAELPQEDGFDRSAGGGGYGDATLATSSEDSAEARERLIGLVELARGGDAEAFGLLYDHYQPSVYRFLYYRTRSIVVAEDLCSETFFRALRNMPSFRWQGKDFGAWLMTIARNLATDHFKAGRTRLELTTEDMGQHDASTEGPENAVLASLTNEILLQSLTKLPNEQRDCLVMRFLQGMSIAETAAALGRSDGAIKQLQLRGVRNLAKLMPEGLR